MHEGEEEHTDCDGQQDDCPAVVAEVAVEKLQRFEHRLGDEPEPSEIEQPVETAVLRLQDVVILRADKHRVAIDSGNEEEHREIELLPAIADESVHLGVRASRNRSVRDEHRGEVLVAHAGPGNVPRDPPRFARFNLRLALELHIAVDLRHRPGTVGVVPLLQTGVRREPGAPEHIGSHRTPGDPHRGAELAEITGRIDAERLRCGQTLPVGIGEQDVEDSAPFNLVLFALDAIKGVPQASRRIRIVDEDLQRPDVQVGGGGRDQIERFPVIVLIVQKLPGGDLSAPVAEPDFI